MRGTWQLAAPLILLGSGCAQLLDSRAPVGVCGDGLVQLEAREECDDGNTISGDGCSSSCRREVCGNGILDVGEECDSGLANDNGGDCTLACRRARCGDGLQRTRGAPPLEVCDDGNLENGDGCNPQCALRGRVSALQGAPGGRGVQDGVGSGARVSGVYGLVSDGGGRLYFWDDGACAVRVLETASGRVSLVAGVVGDCLEERDGFGGAATFAASGTGLDDVDARQLALVGSTLYVVHLGLVRTIDLGNPKRPVQTCGWIDSVGASDPAVAVAADPDDPARLYIATTTQVRVASLLCSCKATPPYGSCSTTLLAGSSAGHKDGAGAAAQFVGITALVAATEGGERVLYVGDRNTVRRVKVATGQVETVAGRDSEVEHRDAAAGADARFTWISALGYADKDGLYVLERGFELPVGVTLPAARIRYGWSTVRRVDPAAGWGVSTVAGTTGAVIDGQTPESDGFGPQARLGSASSAAVVGQTLYVGGDSSIRAVSLTSRQVATAAGVLVQDFRFQGARAVAAGGGMVYAATHAGEIIEVPVSRAGPSRLVSRCEHPVASLMPVDVVTMTLSGSELIYLDRNLGVCRVYLDGKDAAGAAAGSAGCATCRGTWARVYPPPSVQGTAFEQASAELRRWGVSAIARDGQQLYLVARKLRALSDPLDPAGLVRIDLQGGAPQPVKTATALPASIWGAVVVKGRIYVSGASSHSVSVIDLQTGLVRTLGDGLAGALDSGEPEGPRFCNPVGISTDGARLFVGEATGDRSGGVWIGSAVRQIELDGERTSTLLGPGPTPTVVLGTGRRAGVGWPAAIAFDDVTAALYVADAWENAILTID